MSRPRIVHILVEPYSFGGATSPQIDTDTQDRECDIAVFVPDDSEYACTLAVVDEEGRPLGGRVMLAVDPGGGLRLVQ